MEDKTTPIVFLLAQAQAYVNTGIQLFKLKATEKLGNVLSSLASGFVILIFLFLLILITYKKLNV